MLGLQLIQQSMLQDTINHWLIDWLIDWLIWLIDTIVLLTVIMSDFKQVRYLSSGQELETLHVAIQL